MMTNAADDPAPDWRAAELEGRSIEWMEALRFGSPERTLGLTREGRWIVALDHDQRTELHELAGEAAIAALPLLQRPFAEVKVALERRLGSWGTEEAHEPPTDTIYRAALASGSPFWIGAAASWMDESLPRSIPAAELRELASSKRLDQSVRHRLLRVAGRLEAAG